MNARKKSPIHVYVFTGILAVLLTFSATACAFFPQEPGLEQNAFVTPQTTGMQRDASPAPVQETPAPTPTPTPEPTPSAVPEKFAIVWLADTQALAYHDDQDVFQKMGQWIIDQKDTTNIRYIVQTGDLVDNGFSPRQWRNFEVLHHQFSGIIPYISIAGNHDIGVKRQDYSGYLEQPFVKQYPEEQRYQDGRAVFAEFSAGGLDFLIIGAGWKAELESSTWVQEVLRAHPNHIAILLLHSYINTDGSLSYEGEELHDPYVAQNPTVRLVLSGHLRGTGYRLESFDDNQDGTPDRQVHAMMYNYQGYNSANSGQIRMLIFDTATHSIQITTYSPYTTHYFRDDHFKAYEFTLEDAF